MSEHDRSGDAGARGRAGGAGRASTPPHAAEHIAHGGDLDAARASFPAAPEPWLDLSTGINPIPYPVPPLPSDLWSRLPQNSELTALIAAAAGRYGMADPACVVAAPGTQALIQLLPRLLTRKGVAILGPTYQEHELCWRAAGHEVEIITTLDQAAPAQVVVVVNPDNPTGRLIAPAELRALAAGLAARKGLLVVDEAFADVLERNASLAADLPPATLVLRSFGKVYGLAGLRLGFALAAPPLASRLRDALGPWAVSGPALAIGTAALGDIAWLETARERLQADAARLDAMLIAAGLEPRGGTPLYRLVEGRDVGQIAERLGRSGILVRTFAHQPHWLRFGLPGCDEDWRRLGDALIQNA